jgi:hypothetical protein
VGGNFWGVSENSVERSETKGEGEGVPNIRRDGARQKRGRERIEGSESVVVQDGRWGSLLGHRKRHTAQIT